MLDHAIVMGGSVAGLLAAAGLAEQCDRITIIDRDPLPVDGPEAFAPRRGVAQGRIVHRLLARGEQRMEELLPGLRRELLAAGCTELDGPGRRDGIEDRDGPGALDHRKDRDVRRDRAGVDGPVLAPGSLGLTRPVLEGVLRRRVLALPAVTARQGAVAGLLADADGRTVRGVRLRGADVDELRGALVVDAAGRSSRAATWVEALGAERPRALTTRVHVAYTCQRLRLRDGALPEGLRTVSVPAGAQAPFTVDLEPCGNGEHVLSVAGTARNLPPSDLAGLRDLLAQLPAATVADALADAEPVGEPASARAAGGHRLLWETAEAAPEGLVHLGDAAATFTPLYGQGMTMAAVGAVTLREVVRRTGGATSGLAGRFQRELAAQLDPAWDAAVARDAEIPGAELEVAAAPG
ncbi:hypothetical protein ACT3SP_14725 [Brachybacterium sp. AOP43-C2-M15]|uniref:hypothetical protein n=1 Tax=Brachybacterium sp. AOP43-C2-M15 TaxID=3457661 RepID=UPI00403329F5